jgi:hypothetical protein
LRQHLHWTISSKSSLRSSCSQLVCRPLPPVSPTATRPRLP